MSMSRAWKYQDAERVKVFPNRLRFRMESSAENIKIKIQVKVGHVCFGGKERAHGLQKKLVRAALIVAVALASVHAAPVPEAVAGQFSTIIRVNAVVLARTQLKPLRQPAFLVVTETDVQRGYVEVSGASLFEIWNNNQTGCVLTILSSDFPFREAVVTVIGRQIIVYPTGGMIVMPVRGRQQITLDYRFVLTNEAQPGTYVWPLSFSVDPR